MISKEKFNLIREELDNLIGQERSKRAIEYLTEYNLAQSISYDTLLDWYLNGSSQENWQHAYLIERSIPYYKNKIVPWQKRLLYFVGTYIMEMFLEKKEVYINNINCKLYFSKYSGDHRSIHAGPGTDVADFYVWLNNTYEWVEYKFANYKRFPDLNSVIDYYTSGDGRSHLHKAKILIIFLEAEYKFYLINYNTNQYYCLANLNPPANLIGTTATALMLDPLEK